MFQSGLRFLGEARSEGDRAKCTVPFPHPSRQKFSNDRRGGGARCVIPAITLSSCQEEKNGQDLMRVAPGGFDRRLITGGLCFFFFFKVAVAAVVAAGGREGGVQFLCRSFKKLK